MSIQTPPQETVTDEQLPDPGGARREPLSTGSRVMRAVENYGLVILLVLLFVLFSSVGERPATFRSSENIMSILGTYAPAAILALASIIPLIGGQFDLTVGPVAGISAVLMAGLMSNDGLPVVVAGLLAFAAALVIGTINGYFIAYVRVNAFITTLGMASVISGLVMLYSDSSTIIINNETMANIGSSELLGIPIPVYFAVFVALVAYYVLNHTPVGRYLYAVGSNENAARLVGLRVDRIVFSSFVVSAGVASIGGILLLARNGSADQQLGGLGMTLPALAAAFLGATAIKPGRFNVIGTLVAILFVAFSLSGLNLNNVDHWISDFFTGVTLVLAVALSTLVGRRRRGSA